MSGMRRAVCVALFLVGIGIGIGPASAEPALNGAGLPAPPRLRSTAELTSDADQAALLDKLAQEAEVQSNAVGYAGTPSRIFALAQKLASITPREQYLRFRDHKSPIVRGYVIWHVTSTWPEVIEQLYPLLSDENFVLIRRGCVGRGYTVAEILLEELEEIQKQPAALAMLRRAAGDARLGAIQGRALTLIAGAYPQEATQTALGLLGHKDRSVRAAAIGALGLAGAVNHISALMPFTESPDEEIRWQLAEALGHLQGPASQPALRKLMADPQSRVREQAYASYVAQPDCDLAQVRQYLFAPSREIHASVVVALGQQRSPAALALALEYIDQLDDQLGRAEPRSYAASEELLSGMITTQGLAPLMRTLAVRSRIARVRARAVHHLAWLPDAQSLPLFRKILREGPPDAQGSASHGVMALEDRESIPDLVRLLPLLQSDDRLTVAEALLHFRVHSALGILRKVAAADQSYARDSLQRAARELAKQSEPSK